MRKAKTSPTDNSDRIIELLLLDIPISIGCGALMYLLQGIGEGITTAVLTFALIALWRASKKR